MDKRTARPQSSPSPGAAVAAYTSEEVPCECHRFTPDIAMTPAFASAMPATRPASKKRPATPVLAVLPQVDAVSPVRMPTKTAEAIEREHFEMHMQVLEAGMARVGAHMSQFFEDDDEE
jgi:hypothetical protein